MKKWMVLLSLFIANVSSAGQVPGDVNFGLDASPSNHAYQFRLVINGTATTFPTACEAPATGFSQALTNGAIGVSSGRLTVQAYDCATGKSWVTLNGYFDYNSLYWYNLSVNMNSNSFHL